MLQRSKSMQESNTKGEETGQPQRVKTVADVIKKIKAKGRMNANHSWSVCELLAAESSSTQHWRTHFDVGKNWLYEMKNKDGERRNKVEHQKLCESNNDQCRRRRRLIAQNHEADGVERRNSNIKW